MNQIQSKYAVLGSLCALVLMLVVGYAAFSTVLKIKGTSNINSNWDVRITGIEKISSKGSTDVEGTPKFDNLSATFNTNFTTPGDYATYKIEITNNGSMDAKLTKVDMPINTNKDIEFRLNKNQNNEDIANALKQDSILFKKGETGNIGYVYVTVLYKDYEGQKTAQAKTESMTIEFDFEQAGGSTNTPVVPENPLKTVYAYHKDEKTIGTSTLTESDYVTDYTQINGYNESTRPWFLKYDIDEEGVIQNAYACIKCIFIDEPVCMQSGKDSEGNTYYNSNKAILERLQETFEANSGSCSLSDSYSHCSIGILYVDTHTLGGVYAGNDSASAYCRVNGSSKAYCGE